MSYTRRWDCMAVLGRTSNLGYNCTLTSLNKDMSIATSPCTFLVHQRPISWRKTTKIIRKTLLEVFLSPWGCYNITQQEWGSTDWPFDRFWFRMVLGSWYSPACEPRGTFIWKYWPECLRIHNFKSRSRLMLDFCISVIAGYTHGCGTGGNGIDTKRW